MTEQHTPFWKKLQEEYSYRFQSILRDNSNPWWTNQSITFAIREMLQKTETPYHLLSKGYQRDYEYIKRYRPILLNHLREYSIFPIDIHRIALFLEIQLFELKKEHTKKIKSVVQIDKNTAKIWINMNLPYTEFRYMMAVNLGHILLGHEGRFITYFNEELSREQKESRIFANNILVPKYALAYYLRVFNYELDLLSAFFGTHQKLVETLLVKHLSIV